MINSTYAQRMIDHQWPRISWQLGGSSRINPGWMSPVRVAFCLDRVLRDTPALSVRVVGLEVDVPWTSPFSGLPCPVAFDALLAIIKSCPTTLAINFCFPGWTYEDLQEHLKTYRPFNWNSDIETHTIIFTCSESTEVWTRIDPITLTPTGKSIPKAIEVSYVAHATTQVKPGNVGRISFLR